MKKIIKNLIPPSKRLILFSCMPLTFLSFAGAHHYYPGHPDNVNVWIEKGPDNTTKWETQEIAVCCGEPEIFEAKTDITGDTWFTWQGVSHGGASVAFEKGYPIPETGDFTSTSMARIVFKEVGANQNIWSTVHLGGDIYNPAYSEQTNHPVSVTSEGVRFKHLKEDGPEWREITWATDIPDYTVTWEDAGTFDAKTRLATSSSLPDLEWRLYQKSSPTYGKEFKSGWISSTGIISFDTVPPGYYLIEAEDKDGTLGCVATLELDIYPKVELETVTFHGDASHIIKDDGTFYPGMSEVGTHWERGRSEQSPINYNAGDEMEVTFVLFVEPANFAATLLVSLTGNGGGANLTFPTQEVSINPNNGMANFTAGVSSNESFPSTINLINNFNISWDITIKDTLFEYEDQSQHPVYISLGASMPEVHHTTIHLACANTVGLTADKEQEIVDKIFAQFENQSVGNIKNNNLWYYKNFNTGNTTTLGLLASEDGQCGSWVKFFLDMLKVHGISHANNHVFIESDYPDTNAFLVKEWSFQSSGTAISSHYEYHNISSYSGGFDTSASGQTYSWEQAEVSNAPGIYGQGPNLNPLALFGNHQVAYVDVGGGGRFYDPAYGKAYDSITFLSGVDQSVAAHVWAFPYDNKSHFYIEKNENSTLGNLKTRSEIYE